MNVLLIDDDVALSTMLAEYLAGEGFEVRMASDGEKGLAALSEAPVDAVVLDVMMPRLNGIDTLRRIRECNDVPVLMLTARGEPVDRIVGLELGADDYVPKPCDPRELVARLRALLRRARGRGGPMASTVLRSGPLELRAAERMALWHGALLDLTSTEFNLLEALVRVPGQLVDKNALSQAALGRPLARYDRSVDMHVSHLRRKLGDLPDGRSPIHTVRGMGYQWVAAGGAA